MPKSELTVVVRNTIANYAGNLLTALIAFLFIPIYIRYLGIGSYGIIGFFISLQIFLNFLDLGIGMAINREMSRFYHDNSHASYLRKLTHSLQVVYWGIGIGIGILLYFLSPVLSKHWFAGNEMPQATLYSAFIVLSLTIAARWPYSLYSSGIRGMQHQVVLNAYDIFWMLIKNVGSWVVLKYYSPTLEAFLLYQFVVTLLQTTGICVLLWYYMPGAEGERKFIFDKKVLKNISRYAAGMGAATLLGSIIMQLDKILVSKMVEPSRFGYYMVATNIAVLVYNASLPIYIAIFPHFAKLVHNKDASKLKKDFHFYSKLLCTLMMPFSAIVFFSANEILWLWTNNKMLSDATAPILQIMIIGTTLNACVATVHALLLAYNRIRVLFFGYLGACIIMIPLTLFLVNRFGVKGGALAVSIIYAGYFIIQCMIIFKKLGMQDIAINWYMRDILQCLLPVSLVVFLCTHYWAKFEVGITKSELFVKLSIMAIVAYIISALTNEALRKNISSKLFSKYKG